MPENVSAPNRHSSTSCPPRSNSSPCHTCSVTGMASESPKRRNRINRLAANRPRQERAVRRIAFRNNRQPRFPFVLIICTPPARKLSCDQPASFILASHQTHTQPRKRTLLGRLLFRLTRPSRRRKLIPWQPLHRTLRRQHPPSQIHPEPCQLRVPREVHLRGVIVCEVVVAMLVIVLLLRHAPRRVMALELRSRLNRKRRYSHARQAEVIRPVVASRLRPRIRNNR